jgi:FtsP/CotA-like multicopper oxidase with cupredoxin domain
MHRHLLACAAAAVLMGPAVARAAPSCSDILAMFPQPGRGEPGSGGNAFRPLPTLAPDAGHHDGISIGIDAVRFGQPIAGSKPPGGEVWIGNYRVRDVPAFLITPRHETIATLPQNGEENGKPVTLPPGCLADPRLIYGGTHWSLVQGQTIRAALDSKLDYSGSDMVDPPLNGGVPCRSTNMHTHGLLVSPYHPKQPGDGEYGDYVLDVTLAPGSAPPHSGIDDCKASLGGHGHGITTKALEHEIHIPGTPGVSSMADGQHPSGLFWYHPHPHGYSRGQVSGGTTGVITIGKLSDYACTEGGPDPATGKCPTGTSRTRVRLVELKDAQILADQGGPTPFQLRPDYDAAMCDRVPAAGGVNEGECQSSDTGLPDGSKWVFTVNGVEFPTISEPTADQDEVWRIANASPNVSYRLVLVPRGSAPDTASKQPFQVLAIDGVSVPQALNQGSGAYETQEILMMPGTRAEVRIAPPAGGGDFVLRTEVVSTGAHDSADVWPQIDLMAVSWPKQVATLGLTARRSAMWVLGPGTQPSTAPQADRSHPNVPAGCVLNDGDVRAIYFVHRTRPLTADASQTAEVFGILAGIRRKGEDRVRFFDASFNEVPKLTSVADVWKAIIPDPNDIHNAAPAFDTTSFGTICAVRAGQTETWVVQNWSGEDHNFHVHQSRFMLDAAHLGDTTGRWFQFPVGKGRDADVQRTDDLIQAIVAQKPDGSGGSPGWTSAHHDSVPVPRGEGFCADGLGQKGCVPDKDAQGNPIPRECSGDPTDGSCNRPGVVSIQVAFGRDTQVGDFVYHCHILEHEDLGMMARVRVICPDGGTSCGTGEGSGGNGHEHH